ncbi:MAG: 2Fe-2S iron-sulfur cluster-binding protein [Spirochaetota bacterium]
MVDIIIDGETLRVDEKKNLLHAVNETKKHHIPHICFHPTLPVSGNCRMCLVELGSAIKDASGETIKWTPKLQPACNTAVREGMHVLNMKSAKVRAFRRMLMEMYLINHPLDCPVCDKSGECTLQNYAYTYGAGKTRFAFKKRRTEKKKISDRIIRDQNRCIHCGRCQSFFETVTRDAPYARVHRGSEMEFDTFRDHEWENDYQGNTVDLCPVGALTAADFRFKRRVWYLDKKPSLCMSCATGCAIDIHSDPNRIGEGIVRITPRVNEKINGSIICDRGRFGYRSGNDRTRRLLTARIGGKGSTLDAAVAAFDARLSSHTPRHIAVIASAWYSNEDNAALKDHFLSMGITDIDHRITDEQLSGSTELLDELLISRDRHPNSLGAAEAGCRADTPARTLIDRLGADITAAVIVLDPVLEAMDDIMTALLATKAELFIFSAHANAITDRAAVSLPITALGESEGTFVNRIGIPQFVRRAITPPAGVLPLRDMVHRLEKKLAV